MVAMTCCWPQHTFLFASMPFCTLALLSSPFTTFVSRPYMQESGTSFTSQVWNKSDVGSFCRCSQGQWYSTHEMADFKNYPALCDIFRFICICIFYFFIFGLVEESCFWTSISFFKFGSVTERFIRPSSFFSFLNIKQKHFACIYRAF